MGDDQRLFTQRANLTSFEPSTDTVKMESMITNPCSTRNDGTQYQKTNHKIKKWQESMVDQVNQVLSGVIDQNLQKLGNVSLYIKWTSCWDP